MAAELTPFPDRNREDRADRPEFLDEAVFEAGPSVAGALGDLRAELTKPPAPDLADSHVSAAAAAAREAFRVARRRGRILGLAVGASRSAAVVVLALGATTGLAAAEALPRPAARMIVSVADVVNVPVPQQISRSALTAGERAEIEHAEAKVEKRKALAASPEPDEEFGDVSTATSQRTTTTQRSTTTTTEQSSTEIAATTDSTTTTTTGTDESTTTTTEPDGTTTTTEPDESTTTTEPVEGESDGEDEEVKGKSAGKGNGKNSSSEEDTTTDASSDSTSESTASDDSTVGSTSYSADDEVL